MTKRKEIEISYKIVDKHGEILETFKKRGLNKKYILWLANRYASIKYKKQYTLIEI